MRLFLQIDIGDWKQRAYNNLLISYASSLTDDLIGTDIDSESESAVIDLVITLADQAEAIFVFISVMADSNVGNAAKMMRYLHQHQHKINQFVMLGEHPEVENSGEYFDDRFLKAKDDEQVKALLHNFAKSNTTPGQTSGPVQ